MNFSREEETTPFSPGAAEKREPTTLNSSAIQNLKQPHSPKDGTPESNVKIDDQLEKPMGAQNAYIVSNASIGEDDRINPKLSSKSLSKDEAEFQASIMNPNQ